MKVLWAESAVRHLREVFSYVEGENAGAAVGLRRRILATAKRLGQMPLSGRVGRIQGTREAVVPRTPHIVAYEVEGDTVKILGIWHGARLWPDAF